MWCQHSTWVSLFASQVSHFGSGWSAVESSRRWYDWLGGCQQVEDLPGVPGSTWDWLLTGSQQVAGVSLSLILLSPPAILSPLLPSYHSLTFFCINQSINKQHICVYMHAWYAYTHKCIYVYICIHLKNHLVAIWDLKEWNRK